MRLPSAPSLDRIARGSLRPRSLWVLLALLFSASALWANGGTLRLNQAVMGAYRVSAFTDPTPVQVDSLDVSVLVVDGRTGTVVEGLLVELRARHLSGKAPERLERATREAADDPRYYAAKFTLEEPGDWEITVVVFGPEGSGEAAFTIRALRPSLFQNPWVLLLLAILPLGLLGLWISRGGAGSEEEKGRQEAEAEA
jgi:hypothetical protein